MDLESVDWLKTPYPILVHSVQHPHFGLGSGDETGERRNRSLFNPGEVAEVVRYIGLLRTIVDDDEQIGVVTPYKLQAHRIQTALGKEFGSLATSKIKVSVTEKFQGQERQVMIVSTVRSSMPSSRVGQAQVT